MGIKVITVTTQLGSGGFVVARHAAESLGFAYYDWEITSQAAAEEGVSPEVVASAERVPSLAERILDRIFATGFYAGDGPEGVGPSSITLDAALQSMSLKNHREMIEQVVRNLADRGNCVIVGHSAQVILKDRPDVLKVLVHGDQANRAMRLALEEQLSPEEALSRVQRNDRDRAAYFKHYYKVNWLDARLYDLTLNTSVLKDEIAAAILLKSAQEMSDPRSLAGAH